MATAVEADPNDFTVERVKASRTWSSTTFGIKMITGVGGPLESRTCECANTFADNAAPQEKGKCDSKSHPATAPSSRRGTHRCAQKREATGLLQNKKGEWSPRCMCTTVLSLPFRLKRECARESCLARDNGQISEKNRAAARRCGDTSKTLANSAGTGVNPVW